ncbi:unnamed protein product [Vitrella brassicaformis CCMP3155]|uniref:Uncharacterized protein n=1 Tax=Vitrella brassicaformis (strain CCMP3155) TaxID=1169540 RepID=A0A0G4FLS3_VITBC|nr:unnamed protein product [Vitrella brassicaformis CCMP3155]|eukprot:CEM14734.1 unnamed protein product [Vitrella brassicaformis CCMP3155]
MIGEVVISVVVIYGDHDQKVARAFGTPAWTRMTSFWRLMCELWLLSIAAHFLYLNVSFIEDHAPAAAIFLRNEDLLSQID